MRTEILFKDMKRSEYVENFINEKIELLTDKLVQHDSDLHVTVRVEEDKQRTDNRQPIFHCEVTVKSGISAKTYKIVKQDRNLFRAIVSSTETLKVLLGKNHDRLLKDRRRRSVGQVATEIAAEAEALMDFDRSLEDDLAPEITAPAPMS